MDYMDVRQKDPAAVARGKASAKKRAMTPEHMSELGKISAKKRALTPGYMGEIGKKGGNARFANMSPAEQTELARTLAKIGHESMTPERRKARAREAIQARWERYRAMSPEARAEYDQQKREKKAAKKAAKAAAAAESLEAKERAAREAWEREIADLI